MVLMAAKIEYCGVQLSEVLSWHSICQDEAYARANSGAGASLQVLVAAACEGLSKRRDNFNTAATCQLCSECRQELNQGLLGRRLYAGSC